MSISIAPANRFLGFQVYALGCKVNQYDAAVLRRTLEKAGFEINDAPKLVIVSTCAVTQKAITKDRQLINRLRRQFPSAWIIITGCWPQIDKMAASDFMFDKFIFWGTGRVSSLTKKIKDIFADDIQAINKAKDSPASAVGEFSQLAATDRSRYFLKVGDGCNQFCSYCVIPFARGRLSSRPISVLLREARAAVRAGYQEIVLSGIHLGQYGQDLRTRALNQPTPNLVVLLKNILAIKNVGRIRLSSIEINELTPELISLIKTDKRICRHLHISLQSGSDKILSLMGRPYSAKYFVDRVALLRRALPDIAITTDVIVGFPGETEKDFLATCAFVKKLKFSKIHVFSFSLHKMTRAAQLPGKIDEVQIKRRSKHLQSISIVLEEAYRRAILKKYRHQDLHIIVDHSSGARLKGKTEFSFDLEGPLKEKIADSVGGNWEKLIGRIYPVKIA
jgi:threonylcarbamoyladenosine tRNA methylthiotransferase MtaB